MTTATGIIGSAYYAGHTYLLLENRDRSIWWNEAEAIARSLGGNLTTISSPAENDFIFNSFANTARAHVQSSPQGSPLRAGPISLWIGLNDQAFERNFVWSSGETITYTNWQPGEPGGGRDQNYVGMGVDIFASRWHDILNTNQSQDVPFGVIELSFINAVNLTGTQYRDNLVGTSFSDNLSGAGGNDVLDGGGGDDILSGGAGADSLAGGLGVDTASYLTSTVGVKVNLATNVNTDGDAQGDVLTGIENVQGSNSTDEISGDNNANVLRGMAGADTLNGGDGNDTLEGGDGDDVLDGGTGIDTATYASATAAVTVDLSLVGTPQAVSGAGADRISNVENLTGSNYGDTLKGDAGANTIDGGVGDDTLTGGAGADTLIGGAGTDTAIVGASWLQTTVVQNGDGSYSLTVNGETDNVSGVELFQFTNGTFAAADWRRARPEQRPSPTRSPTAMACPIPRSSRSRSPAPTTHRLRWP